MNEVRIFAMVVAMLVSVMFSGAKVHTLISFVSVRIFERLIEVVSVVQLRVSHMVDMIREFVLNPRVRIVMVRHRDNILVMSVVQLGVSHVVHVIGKLVIDPRVRVVVVIIIRAMVRSVIVMLSMRFCMRLMHFFSRVSVCINMMRCSVSSVRVMIPRIEVRIGSVISNSCVRICVIISSMVVRCVQF